MKTKMVYEAPEMSTITVQMETVINASALQAGSPSMGTLSEQEEDWGSWQ